MCRMGNKILFQAITSLTQDRCLSVPKGTLKEDKMDKSYQSLWLKTQFEPHGSSHSVFMLNERSILIKWILCNTS